jgi:hypothetical protein
MPAGTGMEAAEVMGVEERDYSPRGASHDEGQVSPGDEIVQNKPKVEMGWLERSRRL